MKKMYTLEEMIARETFESQQKIKEMSDELILETLSKEVYKLND